MPMRRQTVCRDKSILAEETADQRTFFLRSILMTASASQMVVKQQKQENKRQQPAFRYYLLFSLYLQNKILLKSVTEFP
jgi:hypothetical protein